MKRRFVIRIVAVTLLVTMLLQFFTAFVGVGLFYRFFYARYDTYCPTDLRATDLTAPYTPVSFASGDNMLQGYLIGEGQKGLIVVVHGMRSGMDAHFAEADYFASQGYTVLTYDATGTRTSSGNSRCSVSYARDDLNAALDYLDASPLSDLPVYLYGHSSGGYAAATELSRADAAAILCGFDDPIETMCDTASQYVGFLVRFQRLFLKLWNRITAGADANERASDCINRTSVPVLIVGADSDTVIPADDSLYLHPERVTDPNAVYRLRPGGHSDLWLSPDAVSYRAEMQDRDPASVERLRFNAVDTDFLQEILAFFEQAA